MCAGKVGEADYGGGHSPYQVLQPVEEAEGEGDPAGDVLEGEGNYHTHNTNQQSNHFRAKHSIFRTFIQMNEWPDPI